MSTLKSAVSVNISGNYSVAAGLATKVLDLARKYNLNLANGTTAGKADVIYHAQRTLAASANEDLDFAAGVIDPLTGVAAAFAKIKVLVVIAAAANVNAVVVKRPTTSGVPIFSIADAAVSIGPNGILVVSSPGLAGYPVTAGTGDLINIANSGAGSSVVYDVIVVGTSA